MEPALLERERHFRLQRSRTAVLAAFLGALAIYAWGMAPTVLDRDSAELQVVALTGGVAHTTGYPAFSLVGRLFGQLPLGDPASRINLMSAVLGAVAAALLVIVGLDFGLSPPAALAGAMIYGATFTFWAAALRAEVYTLSMTLFLLALWRARAALRSGRDRDALIAGLLLGLVLTGHLAASAPVAVLGLMLARSVARERRAVVARLTALLFTFVLGLTPYLYLVWADAHHVGFDYLDHVQKVLFGSGTPPPGFDTPWERVRWLVLGRNRYPEQPLVLGLRELARRMLNGGGLMVLFELGPLATALVPLGLVRLARRRPGDAWLLAGLAASSLAFSLVLESGQMIPIFLLTGTALFAILAAHGLEATLERIPAWGRSGAARWLLAMGAATLVMVPPHLLRLRSYEQPIAPRGWQVRDEDEGRPFRLIWRWNEPYAARDYGLGAMRRIPRDALVVGAWRELPVLYYFNRIEHLRPDLSFQPYSYPECLPAVRDWQEREDLARRPIVFLTLPPEMRLHVAAWDSIEVSPGRWIHVLRSPLRDLPAPRGRVKT